MEIGIVIDKIFDLYEQKEALDKEVKGLSSQIAELEASVRATLEETGLESAKTERGTMFLQAETYPVIVDFAEFIKFAYQEGMETMLQKRVSSTAFKEYYKEYGAFPPGTDGTFANKLSRRKAR